MTSPAPHDDPPAAGCRCVEGYEWRVRYDAVCELCPTAAVAASHERSGAVANAAEDTAALRLFYAEIADVDAAVIRDVTALCDALDAANDLGQSMTVGLGRAAEERDQALTEAADLRRQLDAARADYAATVAEMDEPCPECSNLEDDVQRLREQLNRHTDEICHSCGGTPESCASARIKCCPECDGNRHKGVAAWYRVVGLRDSLRTAEEQRDAAREQLRLANIDQLAAEAENADLRRQLDAANERYEAALEQRDAHFEAREAFRVDLEAAEARLDAVIALCDEQAALKAHALATGGMVYSFSIGGVEQNALTESRVRAAATQPAAEPCCFPGCHPEWPEHPIPCPGCSTAEPTGECTCNPVKPNYDPGDCSVHGPPDPPPAAEPTAEAKLLAACDQWCQIPCVVHQPAAKPSVENHAKGCASRKGRAARLFLDCDCREPAAGSGSATEGGDSGHG